jgi:heptosyltransferase-2
MKPLIKLIDKYIGILITLLIYPFKHLKSHKIKKSEIKNIAVIRLWTLGETILTLPLLKQIKQEFPHAKLSIICTTKNKSIFEKTNLADEILLFSPSALNLLTKYKKYDITIDTEPWLNIAGILTFYLGKISLGYTNKITKILLTKKIRWNPDIHEVDNFLEILRLINIKPIKFKKLPSLIIPKNNPIKLPKNKKIIGVHMGTGSFGKSRRWSALNWAALIDKLTKIYNPTIVFIGTQEDKKMIELVKKNIKDKSNIIDISGKDLGTTLSVMSKFNLMITSDTGPMHLSASLGIKTIGLFGPTTPVRFRPYGDNYFIYHKVSCSPCINIHKGSKVPECKYKNTKYANFCMKLIKPSEILNLIESKKLLK